jgi:hypothetical protein
MFMKAYPRHMPASAKYVHESHGEGIIHRKSGWLPLEPKYELHFHYCSDPRGELLSLAVLPFVALVLRFMVPA